MFKYIILFILLIIGIGIYAGKEGFLNINNDLVIQENLSISDNNPVSKEKENSPIETTKTEIARLEYRERHHTDSNPYATYSDSEIDLFIKLEPFQNDIIQWDMENFGYFLTAIKKSDYNNYNIDTLELMAEQNDMKALDVLAWKYLNAHNLKMSNDAHQRAAVLGSTWALKQLGNALVPVSMIEKGQRARVMKQLSYQQAALIRGDKSSVRNTVMSLIRYKGELTDEDIKMIQDNGRKIISQLEAQRAKIDLPAFDNSIPWYVDEFNTWFNQKIIDDAGIQSPLLVLNKG